MEQPSPPNSPQIQVRYAETSSLFAGQFLLNATDEDITIGFSSGYISDPGGKETILPIHTRITMTRQGAKRLHGLLSKIIQQEAASSPGKPPVPVAAQAKLPKL